MTVVEVCRVPHPCKKIAQDEYGRLVTSLIAVEKFWLIGCGGTGDVKRRAVHGRVLEFRDLGYKNEM